MDFGAPGTVRASYSIDRTNLWVQPYVQALKKPLHTLERGRQAQTGNMKIPQSNTMKKGNTFRGRLLMLNRIILPRYVTCANLNILLHSQVIVNL